jgi:hypothetical protein
MRLLIFLRSSRLAFHILYNLVTIHKQPPAYFN